MSAVDHLAPDAIDPQSEELEMRVGKPPRSRKPVLLMKRARRSGRILSTYARAHRGWFVHGSLYAILLVAVRVAMPWPLRALIKPWMTEGQVAASGVGGWHPAVAVGIIYALLVTVLGFADYRLRLNFARFAIGVVRDVRGAVIKGIRRIRRQEADHTAGDLVTRLIGDTARLKAGMKGFLVHVATNGLLFVGISGVLLWMEWRVGLIFLGASLLTILVTTAGAAQIFHRAIKYRRKESQIANTIAARLALHADEEDEEDDGLDDESLGANRSSGRHEASITRIQGLTTWSAHLILAIAVPAALWQAYRAVAAGMMDPSDLFVVMLYALMILGPMVRLTRQGARCGKILASADRLGDLVEATTSVSGADDPVCSELREGILLEEVRMRTRFNGIKHRWFGPVTLRINAGQKIAVIGAPGVGKTTFLSVLAGREAYKGSARWDGTEMRDADPDALGEQIAYVSQVPNWPWLEASEILDGAADGKSGDPAFALLKHGGFRQLRARLRTPGEGKILPDEVSHSERKVLALIRCGTSGHSLKLIDDPVSEIPSKRAARKFLAAFVAAQGGEQTLVVALDRPVALQSFDRVIVLEKKGRVAFDGSPAEWRARRAAVVADGVANTKGDVKS